MDDFFVSRDLLDNMTIEPNRDKYLRNIKESFEVTTSEIKQISENAKDQAQSAVDQVEQFKLVISNQEKQIVLSEEEIKYLKTANNVLEKQITTAVSNIESSKKDVMFSKIVAIVSIMVSVIALFT